MQFRFHFDRSNRSISNDYTHDASIKLEMIYCYMLHACLINDRLLPGNEIESGGMYTCVKDPAKKGTRGKEDWRGNEMKRRGGRSKYSRDALHSNIPFHFFHFRVPERFSSRESFYPVLYLVTFLTFLSRDLCYLSSSSVALIFVNF